MKDNDNLQVSVDKSKITTITGDMYLSALKSAGITSGHVYVTSPVSSTGESALAGIMNAYETATDAQKQQYAYYDARGAFIHGRAL